MQINPINNQSFQAKKFRLVVDLKDYDRDDYDIKNFRDFGQYVKEYSNPKAKKLYKKAQKTNNIDEKIRLYNAMGDFKIKNLNFFEIMRERFNKFLMRNLSFKK